jgi:hypothetical protein
MAEILFASGMETGTLGPTDPAGLVDAADCAVDRAIADLARAVDVCPTAMSVDRDYVRDLVNVAQCEHEPGLPEWATREEHDLPRPVPDTKVTAHRKRRMSARVLMTERIEDA